MADRFRDSVVAQLHALTQQVLQNAHFGEAEEKVLLLFYDEKLKARRDKVPRFYIFARLCDGKLEDSWAKIMIDASRTLLNLKKVDLIENAQPSMVGSQIKAHVGSDDMYRLTATGLEMLQKVRPSVALKLRGWIAVMPPWLVLVGSVAGGLSALWKLGELGILALQRLG